LLERRVIHQAKETTMPNDSGTQINEDTMNKDYDLVSVLYHALQAAETCSQHNALRAVHADDVHFLEAAMISPNSREYSHAARIIFTSP
jgi:hypothetical protein